LLARANPNPQNLEITLKIHPNHQWRSLFSNLMGDSQSVFIQWLEDSGLEIVELTLLIDRSLLFKFRTPAGEEFEARIPIDIASTGAIDAIRGIVAAPQ
jgi:hypothetical protein